MPGRLADRVALITGGSTGIGLATAARLLAEGARVVIASDEPDNGARALQRLGDAGAACYVECDVANPADCDRAVATARDAFGRLDALFANAAIGTIQIGGTVETIAPEQWERAWSVNLRGVAQTCQAALPALRAAGGGAVVLTSSISAITGTAARPTHAYAAMKGALLSLTRAMAVTYGPERIRVNAVLPGLIRTRLTADLLDDPERARISIAAIPLGCAGEPEDIANAVLFLLSDEARFITGTTLVVDGGATAL